MTTFLRKRRLRLYDHVLSMERGGYHQHDVKYAGAWEEKTGEAHEGWTTSRMT